MTQTDLACPVKKFTTGALCEFSDANCVPQGARSASVDGLPVTYRWPIAGCLQTVFQNGDLDFDGTPYQADWPDGTRGHPTSFEYIGPFTAGGATYPTVQFESNAGGSEFLCDTVTGAGCATPPTGAAFYPFWTLGSARSGSGHACVWNFGNVITGHTVTSFGGAAQYGTPDVARYGGTQTSVPAANPQPRTRC